MLLGEVCAIGDLPPVTIIFGDAASVRGTDGGTCSAVLVRGDCELIDEGKGTMRGGCGRDGGGGRE